MMRELVMVILALGAILGPPVTLFMAPYTFARQASQPRAAPNTPTPCVIEHNLLEPETFEL